MSNMSQSLQLIIISLLVVFFPDPSVYNALCGNLSDEWSLPTLNYLLTEAISRVWACLYCYLHQTALESRIPSRPAAWKWSN